jgi:hypothetical protein
VNSAFGDFGPGFFENDEIGVPVLYFASTRPGGLGSADIYRSALQRSGGFGPAMPVPELNSPQGDFRPSLRADGLETGSMPGPPDVAGLGLRDIWCRGAVHLGAVVGPDQPRSSRRLVATTSRPGGRRNHDGLRVGPADLAGTTSTSRRGRGDSPGNNPDGSTS